MPAEALSVAVLGTGRMGAAMAKRLHGNGFAVVVHNRTPEKAAALGLPAAASAAEAVAGADVVLVSLADDAAVQAVYPLFAESLLPGAVVVETSTIHPATVRELSATVPNLLDAPVSGSVPVVERGELTFMVGGSADALERVRPVLETLGARIFHLGELGSGSTMKLAVNSAVHALNQALAEALVLAEKAGVPREAAYDVLAASAVGAPFVHYKRAAFLDPGQVPVAFALDLVAKDLTLIGALASNVEARMDQLETNRRVVAEALERGMGGRDMSSLADLLRG